MDGAITPLSLKGNWRGPSFHPQNLAVDADGNLWATCGTNKTHHQQSNDAPDPYGSIRKVAPSGKIVKVARIPTMDSDPRMIVIAPSGDVWFSEARGAIGFVSGDAAPVEIASQGNNPVYPIVVGPDQNIWFGETFNDTICRVTLPYSPSESPTCFTLPAGAGPAAIVTGPGGYLYMTEFNAGKVAQVTMAGTIRAEAPLQQGSFPKGITFGSDGNLYVSEFGTGSIARISMVGSGSGTAFGAVTELAIPTSKSGPWGIVSGPDGNIWFTESLSGQIGKLTI
jgi:virginiamycin B lyase